MVKANSGFGYIIFIKIPVSWILLFFIYTKAHQRLESHTVVKVLVNKMLILNVFCHMKRGNAVKK